jgi:response regulator RpfG family c-di-GMP phosphodiesterase
VDLNHRPDTMAVRKVLITGQAGMEDTVKAINEGGLDHFIAKPWTPEQLHDVVRTQLTEFVLANEDDLKPYVAALDGTRLLEAMASRGSDR